MIILYGSTARGDNQNDEKMENGHKVSYNSDYDLFIITSNTEKANADTFWFAILNKLEALNFDVSIHIQLETIGFVNEILQQGHYFFDDLKTDGIFL